MFGPNKHINKRLILSKTKFLIGIPAVPPSIQLIKALKDLLPLIPEIKEGFVFMKGTDSEEPVLTLGILFQDNNPTKYHEIFSSIEELFNLT